MRDYTLKNKEAIIEGTGIFTIVTLRHSMGKEIQHGYTSRRAARRFTKALSRDAGYRIFKVNKIGNVKRIQK